MKIRIGTRKSKLALIQSEMAEQAISAVFPDIETEFIHITTKGDMILDKPLEKIGGKGVFIDEIEKAMLEGKIDIAVHSAKDLPLKIASGTCICALLPRADAHDMLVSNRGKALPADPVIGTSSTRRTMGVKKLFPQAVIKDIRGNVDTRLRKLSDGRYDGIILAAAGLSRLGALSDERFLFTEIDFDTLVPAPCQGIIAIQARVGEIADMLTSISDSDAFSAFTAERQVLELLDAGCSSPVGAYARTEGSSITLTVTKDQRHVLTDSADITDISLLTERLVKEL